MEVDDAVSSPPTEKGAENGKTARHSSRRMAATLRASEEDPPGRETPTTATLEQKCGGADEMKVEDKDNDGKSTFSTPFKLRVSEDEGSQDGVQHSPTYEQQESRHGARHLKALYVASDEEAEDEEQVEETDAGRGALKRKRYEVRRSGSEECLLGFDEQSGEAELVKDDGETMLKSVVEKANGPPSPPVAKKPKQSSAAKSTPKTEAAPVPVASPASASATSPTPTAAGEAPVQDSEPVAEAVEAHVVADVEENTNGATAGAATQASTVRAATAAAGVVAAKKVLSPQDDFYKKPFDFGWKRELVWRANMETSKDKADVYFITPSGKKLRARSDIVPLLDGELTIDHFSFAREPLGAGPEFEIVRSAKPSSRISITAATLAAAPTTTNIGKRISKPKGPKGASPPPQGWTPTRALKVNNAALLSSASRHGGGGGGSLMPSTPPSNRAASSSTGTSSKGHKSSKKHVNDIENDLKQIKESINNIRKPLSTSLDAAFLPHTVPAAVATAAAVEHSNKLFATNFFANVSFAYDALLCILKYLKIHERPRAASVCKLWHLAAKDTSLWHTVRMKNSKVCNWSGFAAALRRGETKHLDLRKMLLASTRGDDMWQDFSEYIGTVYSLEVIDLCRCSARVVESLFQSNKQLRVLNAIAINDDTINLEHIGQLQQLEELRLRTCEPGTLAAAGLQPLKSVTQLAHLSLTAVRDLGSKAGVEVLAELSGLRSLELGECGAFDATFADVVLPKLTHLQRLRLENGQETGCCTLNILEAVAQLAELSQLELVNFDIKPGFDERLRECANIRKLLIIPTYISQSATTNHIVLSAVQQVADTLRVFTWGVTVELLRVTALYVDQCEESTKKQKHHFDECIPVLKPVPGAPSSSEESDSGRADKERSADKSKRTDDDTAANEMPQIEILPLDKVESILGENLPHTKYTIVKVPYHVTCKQQLVE